MVASVLLVLIIYGVWIEPDQIEVHHVWISDSYLGKVFGKKVLVQLSDLHIGKFGQHEEKVLKILDELKPDIIFLTGDYVKWEDGYEAALMFLSRLKAKIGIWAVMGDYDYSNSRKSCLFCHREGSGKPADRYAIRFLRDTSEIIDLPDGRVVIAGTNIENENINNMKQHFMLNKHNLPVIILSHSPLDFDQIPDDQKVLMLAGDTHGGQVPLPSWVFRLLGYEKNARYNQGLFEKGRKKMFVSRGIGTSHLPVRIFRRPEVAVLHFQHGISEK